MPADDTNLLSTRADAAIAEYLAAAKGGAAPDRRTFLERYPELRAELETFLNDHAAVDAAARAIVAGTSTDGEAASTGPATSLLRAPLAFPRTFGKFELLEEIARGGMGVVYKARQAAP